jgi:hypothetical protein
MIILLQMATKAYYCLVMTGDFASLGLSSNDDDDRWREAIEMDPFIIELPTNTDLRQLASRIESLTGVTQVYLRCQTDRRNNNNDSGIIRATVSARGSVETLHALRSLLTVTPNLDQSNVKQRDFIAHLIAAKINNT